MGIDAAIFLRFRSLHLFLSKPTLEAMELVYWPSLFKWDLMETWFLGKWWMVISNPSLIRTILQQPEEPIHGSIPHALIGEYMGTNVLYSKGKEWRRHRRVINPAFHHEWSPATFAECANQAVAVICERPDGVDVQHLFSRMMLDALGKAVLGVPLTPSVPPPNAPAQHLFPISNFGMVADPLASAGTRRRNPFRTHIGDLIQEKRRQMEFEPCNNLLALMIDASQKDHLISDRELINNAVVMFAAGHDTSANTLSFTLYHLCKYPPVQQKARDEVNRVLVKGRTPTPPQLKQLTYLEAVIMESMRITPTLPQLRRKLEVDLPTPSRRLPKGTLVLLQTYTAMNHPDYWTRPDEFNPDRFLDESNQLNHQATRNFFGFGAGTRGLRGDRHVDDGTEGYSSNHPHELLTLPPNSPHQNRIISKDPVCRPVDLRTISPQNPRWIKSNSH
ncbi:hypothetical protein L0F63_000760 [Massospora cicadina]|nr:hypothetical protein L0F63_000760 [Massospora cicadina]